MIPIFLDFYTLLQNIFSQHVAWYLRLKRLFVLLKSIPSNSIPRSLALIIYFSWPTFENKNFPSSNLLYQIQNPFRSQYNIFTLFLCLFLKTNKCRENGSSHNLLSTNIANPSIDLPICTASSATNIFISRGNTNICHLQQALWLESIPLHQSFFLTKSVPHSIILFLFHSHSSSYPS